MNNAWLAHHGILGMKWGVRRYEDENGHLTEAGKKRYSKEYAQNEMRAPDKKYSERKLNDIDRWVEHDRTYAKQAAEQGRNLTNSLKEIERATDKKKEKPRMDLSNMSDKELRDAINRELLERQYNQVFNAPEVNRGREIVKETLDIAGGVLGVTASALGIALAVQQLKKGG